MRPGILLLVILLPAAAGAAGVPGEAGRWGDLIAPAQTRLRAVVSSGPASEPSEVVLLRALRAADGSFTLDELTTIVRIASTCCRDSVPVAQELTRLLLENHRIYTGRMPTEASQFRGFLLASLAAFPPSDALYGHVRNELVFGGHAYGIGAAAVAATSFPERAQELVPIMERYLAPGFVDEWIDLTTPDLDRPANATRARHEIIRTLVAYGPRAYRSVAVLDQIVACTNCGTYAADPALPRAAAKAAEQIRSLTPPCCRTHGPAATLVPQGLGLIDRRQRKPFTAPSMKLLDQDGRSLDFAALRGRPFVLTFFYSRCTNLSKCVMTVRRLAALAADCAKHDLADRVGIYGMTYDPQFDGPSLLRKYGSIHGMRFSRNVRLLKTEGELASAFRDRLQLRVNYGGGSVNQHAVQLFVFDREGRLAATDDNELWSPADVRALLARLAAE